MKGNCYQLRFRCASLVGRRYPAQRLRLGFLFSGGSCVRFNIVLHELGHAIGFYHEHQRPDRDDYICTNLFSKKDPDETTTLGYGYDYASIMHYRSGRIVAKDKGIAFGAARELSPLDILKANRLYRCGKLLLDTLLFVWTVVV